MNDTSDPYAKAVLVDTPNGDAADLPGEEYKTKVWKKTLQPSPQISVCGGGVNQGAGAPHAATALLLSHAAISARARAIRMFEGPPPEPEDEDVWEEIANEMTKTQKVLKGLHPIAMGTANNAIVVLAALTAWFLMPPFGPCCPRRRPPTSAPPAGTAIAHSDTCAARP